MATIIILQCEGDGGGGSTGPAKRKKPKGKQVM